MIRLSRVPFAVALAIVLVFGATGCEPTVEVRTGTRIVCDYGEVVSDGVKVIKVPASDAGKYRVKTVTRTCDRHEALEDLYAAAQDALAAGDLAAAKAALAKVVAADSGFGQAQQQLDAIAKGKKPAPDRSSGGSTPATSTPKPGDTQTGNPSEILLKWAPDALEGFSAADPTIDALNISRNYSPKSGADGGFLVITAEQFSSAAMAKQALKSQVKDAYARDRETVKVKGHSAYFGTDGRQYAALGFTEGSVMVAMYMIVPSGDSPEKLRAAVLRAAQQLP